ncbi:MAG: hypothetical protein M1835_005031 [Candelina submexicana]|nr:MAG: hypothetical protein M1835_005031 [Candelina submexicana]
MSDLLKNPPGLAAMRQLLFELPEEVLLTAEDYQTYSGYLSQQQWSDDPEGHSINVVLLPVLPDQLSKGTGQGCKI